jgi:photosystem II stability/assembly factor-like uncharacterized protein
MPSSPAFADGRRAWQIWQVAPGHPERPGEVWAGTREAGLFRSRDGGETWVSVASLNDHPTHDAWLPGGGGLLLHTILIDPDNPNRLFACISMGGAFRSDDGGERWQPVNHGVPSNWAEVSPGTQLCVHKMALHPAQTGRLYQQHHTGVYRSDDHGDNWVDISNGLSSRFGFSLAVHPRDPDTLYVVPHISEKQRVIPHGQMAVWRSRTGGENWEALRAGLPDNAWFTVLREALAVDACDPAGVYAGTHTGQLFHSRDEGSHWELLAGNFPSIICVNAACVTG